MAQAGGAVHRTGAWLPYQSPQMWSTSSGSCSRTNSPHPLRRLIRHPHRRPGPELGSRTAVVYGSGQTDLPDGGDDDDSLQEVIILR